MTSIFGVSSVFTGLTQIPERSDATPGLWNQRFTQIDNNFSSAQSFLNSANIALPAQGRTVATLSAYLANNAIYNLLDFGVLPTTTVDQGPAINTAIAAIAALGGGVVRAPRGNYLVVTPLNLTNLGSTQITLVGDGHGEAIYNTVPTKGTNFYGRTGTQAVIETQGSHFVTFSDFGIYSLLADTNRSAVGIFISRTTFQASAQYHDYRRLFITLANRTGANAGRGSIALEDAAGEHGLFDHCEFIADTPLELNDDNGLAYAPTYGTLSVTASCTFNQFRMCSFIALSQEAMELRGILSTTFLDCYYGAFSQLTFAVLLNPGANAAPGSVRFLGGQMETYDSFISLSAVASHDIDIDVTLGTTPLAGPLILMNAGNNIVTTGLRARFLNPHAAVVDLIGTVPATGAKVLGGELVLENGAKLNASALAVKGATIKDHNATPATISLLAGSTYQLQCAAGTITKAGRVATAWTTSWTPNLGTSTVQELTGSTSGAAFTINAPTNAVPDMEFELVIKNTSGGALGAVTSTAYKTAGAITLPANGFSRSYRFMYDGTNYVERSRSAADTTN